MKRIYVILFLGQLLLAGLYLIHIERQKLKEGYKIGRLLELKEEKLIQLDKEAYFVEKLKNPKNIMKRAAEIGVKERPADQKYFESVYEKPEERLQKTKEFHDKLGNRWKAQMAEIDTLTDIDE